MDRNSIREFYLHKNVLITGATGFIGLALVEKLLRSLPEIKKIYLVTRTNEGVNLETRIENYFDNELLFTMGPKSIREFYHNKNVLITGATGFLGMALLEKLLRSFPEINKIYLVVRSKKYAKVETRISNYFDNKIFATIKSTIKNYDAKIVWVEGDVCLPNLGIHEKQLEEIIADVNIIIHSASSIKFNMPFKPCIKNNIGGAFNALQLACKCHQLKSFMYVSTLYVNHKKNEDIVEERLYPHPLDPMVLLKMAENSNDEEIAMLIKEITPEWCNLYLYTKNAAENLVYKYRNNFPIGIFRPGAVMFSKAEPIPYWAVTTAGLPKIVEELRRGYDMESDKNSNCVPVDMTVNGLIAAVRDSAYNGRHPKFYNYASGSTNLPLFTELTNRYNQDWKQLISYNSNAHEEYCKKMDAELLSKSLKPYYLENYKRYQLLYELLTPFLQQQYESQTDNINELWSQMSEEEKQLLDFDLSIINWTEYFDKLYQAVPKIG